MKPHVVRSELVLRCVRFTVLEMRWRRELRGHRAPACPSRPLRLRAVGLDGVLDLPRDGTDDQRRAGGGVRRPALRGVATFGRHHRDGAGALRRGRFARRDPHRVKGGDGPGRTCTKGGWGFHPMLWFAHSTDEALSGLLPTGSAVANTVAHDMRVLDPAVAWLPVAIALGHHVGDDARRLRTHRAHRPGGVHPRLPVDRSGLQHRLRRRGPLTFPDPQRDPRHCGPRGAERPARGRWWTITPRSLTSASGRSEPG
jgi:hypothetical protein